MFWVFKCNQVDIYLHWLHFRTGEGNSGGGREVLCSLVASDVSSTEMLVPLGTALRDRWCMKNHPGGLVPQRCFSLFLLAPEGSNLLLVYTSSKLQQTPCQFNFHLGTGRGGVVRYRGLWPFPDHLPGEVLVLSSQFSSQSLVHNAGGAMATLKLHSPDCAVHQVNLNLPSYSDSYSSHPYKNFQNHRDKTLLHWNPFCIGETMYGSVLSPCKNREEMLTTFYYICVVSQMANKTPFHACHSFIKLLCKWQDATMIGYTKQVWQVTSKP